jgi:leucyl/phenylalanyl-tRNA--protein transferase
LGFAHSVEVYQNNELVGGLYGVSLGSAFFGESMFHTKPNASKVAFHYLMENLKQRNYKLLDTQFINDNVKRFGAIEIPKRQFMKILKESIALNNKFTD